MMVRALSAWPSTPSRLIDRRRRRSRSGSACCCDGAVAARLLTGKSAIGAPQCRLALLRTLPCRLGTPAGQNFTQVPDRDIDCGSQVNLGVSAIVHAIVAEPQYFGAH